MDDKTIKELRLLADRAESASENLEDIAAGLRHLIYMNEPRGEPSVMEKMTAEMLAERYGVSPRSE